MKTKLELNYSISSSFLKPYNDLHNERTKEPSMTMPNDLGVSWSIFWKEAMGYISAAKNSWTFF